MKGKNMDTDTLGYFIYMENQERKETCAHRHECPLEDCVSCAGYEKETKQ